MPGTGIGIGTGIAWRKGKRGGSAAPVNPGQSLFDAYKTRVEDDSGSLISDPETLDLYNLSLQNDLRDNLVFHANARAGNRLTLPALEKVNKSYSMDGNKNDFVQTTGSSQPELLANGWGFDGIGTFLDGGNPNSMQTGGDKSLMVWAKANTITPSLQGIFGAGTLEGGATGIGIYLTDTGYGAQVRQGGVVSGLNYEYTEANAPDPLGFFHIGVIRRGDITELYLNGVMVFSSAPIVLDSTPSKRFSIGHSSSSSGRFYFDGIINDARAYNTAITSAQINQIYNQTKGAYV